MRWTWQAIVQARDGSIYDFRSSESFRTKKKCIKSLDKFLKEELREILEGEGETDIEDLPVVDVSISYGGEHVP